MAPPESSAGSLPGPGSANPSGRTRSGTAALSRHRTQYFEMGPPGTSPADLFGWASSYGNGQLWASGLGPGGVTVPSGDMVSPDGSISWKYGWWRKAAGHLTITGRRLDAPAPPLTSWVPSGYGNIGFRASGVTFPSEGCWQVTGKTAHTSLTFVTLVVTKAHHAVIPGNG